ncbi:MAG: hypothetical protein BWX65_00895 [Bacteroidetes bacterium ADurb.Bin057]|nr:MAG: hypothetical protein BWX65_00895 [Bacteroidetes bacterium ADurb.Bin057]HPO48577.1 hypothetical protein [Paludibacteraceae bacterium]
MKKTILVGVLQCLTLVLFAVEPAGYYNSAEGKSGETLRQALFSKIKDHYNVGYDGLYNVYPTSDVTADGKVWDMYSTCTWTHGQKNAVITKQYAIVTIANILCRKVGLVKQVLWFPMPFTFILPTAK